MENENTKPCRRNPYVVLGIKPVDTGLIRKEMKDWHDSKTSLLEHATKMLSASDKELNLGEYPHIAVLKRKREDCISSFEKHRSDNNSDLAFEVKSYIAMLDQAISAYSDKERYTELRKTLKSQVILELQTALLKYKDTQEKNRQLLPKISIPIPQPQKNPFAKTLPCLEDLYETTNEILEKCKNKRPRKEENKKIITEIIEELSKCKKAVEIFKKRASHLDKITSLCGSIITQFEKNETFWKQLKEKYKELVLKLHPDKNSESDTAFMELQEAYDTLISAFEEERNKLATDLVFGQDTSTWSDEMRKAVMPIVRAFGGIFCLEWGGSSKQKTCESCNGHGLKIIPNEEELFPVPHPCVECKGSGKIPLVAIEIREMLKNAIDNSSQ